MKNALRIVIIAIFGYILWNSLSRSDVPEKESVTVSGAWALYPLMVNWARDYQSLDTAVMIDVTAGGAGKGMTDALSGMVDIGMISREIYPDEIAKGAWFIAAAEDAVVATMNAENPYRSKIYKTGVTRDSMTAIYLTGTVKDWRTLTGTGDSAEIHVYSRSDACGAKETFAAFLKGKPDDFNGVGILGDPGIAGEVCKNPHGVGYNNIGYFFDPETRRPHKGLCALPIDLNGNGVLDPEENFYEDLPTLMKAVADGRFPRPPARELYLVMKQKPQKEGVRRFLRWILTEGQLKAAAAGYIPLSKERVDFFLKQMDD